MQYPATDGSLSRRASSSLGSQSCARHNPQSPAAAVDKEKTRGGGERGSKATLEGFGCTGGKIEKEDYGYGIDDVKCKGGQEYEFKLDPNFKLIVMTRD